MYFPAPLPALWANGRREFLIFKTPTKITASTRHSIWLDHLVMTKNQPFMRQASQLPRHVASAANVSFRFPSQLQQSSTETAHHWPSILKCRNRSLSLSLPPTTAAQSAPQSVALSPPSPPKLPPSALFSPSPTAKSCFPGGPNPRLSHHRQRSSRTSRVRPLVQVPASFMFTKRRGGGSMRGCG